LDNNDNNNFNNDHKNKKTSHLRIFETVKILKLLHAVKSALICGSILVIMMELSCHNEAPPKQKPLVLRLRADRTH